MFNIKITNKNKSKIVANQNIIADGQIIANNCSDHYSIIDNYEIMLKGKIKDCPHLMETVRQITRDFYVEISILEWGIYGCGYCYDSVSISVSQNEDFELNFTLKADV